MVVDHVPVAAAGAFDLFDDPVEPLGAGVRDVLGEGDQDGRPPGLDRAGEPGRFGQVGRRSRRRRSRPAATGSSTGSCSASSSRRRSLTAQAAPISPVGSAASSMVVSRRHCLVDRCSAPVSSSLRFTQTGSPVRPRRPSWSRVTRCRTSVTMALASATRCHLSTASLRVRQRGPDPRRVRRRRVDDHDLDRGPERVGLLAEPVRTQPPVRPGANPSSDPGPSGEQSTKLVSHGSDRFQVMPSRIQRTDRNRVSSIPRPPVGSGSGSHLAAAATRALWAVGQDTPYSAATSETGRLLPAIARRELVPEPFGDPAPRPDRRSRSG